MSVMLSCLFIAALWSPAGKGLACWLSCVWHFLVFCHFHMWCPRSDVVLDCINAWYLPLSLLSLSNMIFNSDKNQCAVDSCMNGGTCVELYASLHCSCPVGTTGIRCEHTYGKWIVRRNIITGLDKHFFERKIINMFWYISFNICFE